MATLRFRLDRHDSDTVMTDFDGDTSTCVPNPALKSTVMTGFGESNKSKRVPNPALKSKHPILFEKTTSYEEQTLIFWRYAYFAVYWLVVAFYAAGLLKSLAFGAIINVVMLRWMLANHNTMHMRSAPSTSLFFRVCTPPMGFQPVAATFGDNVYQHLKDHHLHTKEVLDVNDPDSWWSTIPLPLMVFGLMVSPSDASAYEILGQYMHGPVELWGERIVGTLTLWTQYAILHQMGVLLPTLLAAHVGCVATFIFFHGLLHRPSYYQFLVAIDPSGRRRIPYVDAVFNLLIDPAAWLEMKFHDVHHAFVGIGDIHMHYTSGRASADQIEQACVSMVDEGLFVNADGHAVSPLESVGHRLGSHRAYLEGLAQVKKLTL